MNTYPIVPGRGLSTGSDTKQRLDFLEMNGIKTDFISKTSLDPDLVSKNIESFIGSVEVPVGLVGPLLFKNNEIEELVYTPAGTMEGALLASLNRGAKVVSLSGGFSATVIHQKMIRCPMFIFNNIAECFRFKEWTEQHVVQIRQVAEQYSNHAKLQNIEAILSGRSVHLKFVYTTGDASGQNMTTTCTWHAVLWIQKNFTELTGIEPVHFVIEGNGASDKKVSQYSMMHGRGVHVVAECELEEKYIEKVLRTNSANFITCYNSSITMSRFDGMVGYTINAVNAIAAIFVATGQDLASIHESGVGVLNVEKTNRGLYFSLHLPSLVIGTIGGGTHLPKQKEALQMSGCDGTGKINRFAQIIAGFALSLEISTFAAIVGGQFAKAHEKLGRNKPVNWLTKAEINLDFIKGCLHSHLKLKNLTSLSFNGKQLCDNGIIIGLTNRVNKKLTGFQLLEIEYRLNGIDSELKSKNILLKSKPLDKEVIKGLHLMASAIDPELSNLISEYQDVLEYKNCHIKELQLYDLLVKNNLSCTPEYYGSKIDVAREIYVVLLELLQYDELRIINSENSPEKWGMKNILSVVQAINQVHTSFSLNSDKSVPSEIEHFEPWKAKALYKKFAEIIQHEYDDSPWFQLTNRLGCFIEPLEIESKSLTIEKTIVHNDLNSRNIAVRNDDRICIYDWELAVINFPHRDIIEFLSFVLPVNFEPEQLREILEYHYSLQTKEYSWEEWKRTYIYSLKEYLVTRVSFYLSGRIILEFEFAERIFLTSFRMIDTIESWNS